MEVEQRPAKARTFDIEGHAVRCVETGDGKGTWLCECAEFQERAARWRCIDEGSIGIC